MELLASWDAGSSGTPTRRGIAFVGGAEMVPLPSFVHPLPLPFSFYPHPLFTPVRNRFLPLLEASFFPHSPADVTAIVVKTALRPAKCVGRTEDYL